MLGQPCAGGASIRWSGRRSSHRVSKCDRRRDRNRCRGSARKTGLVRSAKRPQNNDFFSLRVPEFPLKLNCHASITKRDSFRRLDQGPCDSDCLADHHLSGFDNRLRDVRLAIGSVNRFAGRFAEICSAFKSDSRTISNSHSHSHN